MSDATSRAILDATRASVLDFGIRRTTLTDVARRAGVSRMTVYRRYPDVDAVLRELMTHEFGGVMSAIARRAQDEHGRGRVVAHLLAGVDALADHPLLRKILDAEPELLLPYVLDRMGETQRAAVALIADDVAAGQRDGSIRAGEPRVIAQGLLLVVQSFLLSGRIAADEVPPAALRAELAHLLDAALRP